MSVTTGEKSSTVIEGTRAKRSIFFILFFFLVCVKRQTVCVLTSDALIFSAFKDKWSVFELFVKHIFFPLKDIK